VSGAQLPPLAHGVFGALLVSSLYISLAFLFTLLALRLIRRGPGAPLLEAVWWRRINGSRPHSRRLKTCQTGSLSRRQSRACYVVLQ